MKIVTVSMVRDEADIVELFVRHNLQVVDAMVIVDHASSDGTSEILEALVREGLPIQVLQESMVAFAPEKVLTREMRRAAKELEADWVIPIDADEFLGTNAEEIRSIFEKMDPGTVYGVDRRTYVPREEDLQKDDFLFERIAYRRDPEGCTSQKVIVPRKVAKKSRVHLKRGNHGVRNYFKLRHKTLPLQTLEGLWFVHFPVRSRVQMQVKAIQNWIGAVAAVSLDTKTSWHYRPMIEALRRGEMTDDKWIANYALNYSLPEDQHDVPKGLLKDPMPSNIGPENVKYPRTAMAELLPTLFSLAEAQADKLARLERQGFWERIRGRNSS